MNTLIRQLGPQDINSIIGAFEKPTDTRECGLKLDNIAYQCIRCDNHAIYAKVRMQQMDVINSFHRQTWAPV